MIVTLLRIFWLHLRRDRVVWLLTFIVPVAFFTIFAMIFGSQGRDSTPTVRVAVVDEDQSEFSNKLTEALKKDKSLRVTTMRTSTKNSDSQSELTRDDAEALVRDGKVSVAILLPAGLGKAFPSFSGERPKVELLADTSDPVASQMLAGMLQWLAMTAAPDSMMVGGIEELTKWGGPLTEKQKEAFESAKQILQGGNNEANPAGNASMGYLR